jgi:membrane associated rhomboid family serine protease
VPGFRNSIESDIKIVRISKSGTLADCLRRERLLSKFEIIAALLLAVAVFVVLKVIGLVVKFALGAAVLGFVAGLLLARALRR